MRKVLNNLLVGLLAIVIIVVILMVALFVCLMPAVLAKDYHWYFWGLYSVHILGICYFVGRDVNDQR